MKFSNLCCVTGRKIEVKIISAGLYDKDTDDLHILSDDETSAFNKMIVTILVGYFQLFSKILHKLTYFMNSVSSVSS